MYQVILLYIFVVKVVYIQTFFPGWKFSTGFVTDKMLKEHMPSPGDETLIVMCGPPAMLQYACEPNLDKLGYSKENRFCF